MAVSLAFHIIFAVVGIGMLVLWFRRFGLARLGTGLQVSLIFWGWVLAQYPLLIPPSFTIVGSAAPDATLRALLIATAFGGIVLGPSLWYLFHIFKTVPADPGVRQP